LYYLLSLSDWWRIVKQKTPFSFYQMELWHFTFY
jgi:hypothetical protein